MAKRNTSTELLNEYNELAAECTRLQGAIKMEKSLEVQTKLKADLREMVKAKGETHIAYRAALASEKNK